MTDFFCLWSQYAKCTASVDLPTPPFLLAVTIIMQASIHADGQTSTHVRPYRIRRDDLETFVVSMKPVSAKILALPTRR